MKYTTDADSVTITINMCGAIAWVFIWKYFDLFKELNQTPMMELIFYGFIGTLVFNVVTSRNASQAEETEIQKLKEIENDTRTLCGHLLTVFLLSKTMFSSGKTRKTFRILMSAAISSSLLVLLNLSIPQKKEDIRVLRKVEGICLNMGVSFSVLMVLFLSVHFIHK
tara:strand:- start:1 stop:501 length:501 start_codon:yes stop_codon:yes gene_type:complete